MGMLLFRRAVWDGAVHFCTAAPTVNGGWLGFRFCEVRSVPLLVCHSGGLVHVANMLLMTKQGVANLY